MSQPNILVVGSTNMDLVVSAQRVPNQGETIMGRDLQTVHGGKGANQAVACARLGARTTMLGCVGGDAFGEELRLGLEREGVDVSHVRVDAEAASGIAMIIVDATGDNSIVVAPGANNLLTVEDVEALAFAENAYDAVLAQLEIPLEVIAAAFRQARAAGARTILDAGPARKLPPDLLRHVDVVSPNRSETEAILDMEVGGDEELGAATRRLQSLGPKEVVLKLGEEGALVTSGQRSTRIPAPEISPVDTTGAGDAFTAALAVFLAEGKDIVAAARLAACAGALAATVFGAQPSMPGRDALQQFAEEQGVPWE